VRWRVKEAREPLLLFNCMDKRSTRWVSVESCLATAILVDKRNEWIQITAPLYNCTCGTSMPRTNLQVLVLVRAPSPFASCWIITFCFWSNSSLFASRWMRLDLAVLEISHYFNGPVTRVKLYAHWDLKHGGTLALYQLPALQRWAIYIAFTKVSFSSATATEIQNSLNLRLLQLKKNYPLSLSSSLYSHGCRFLATLGTSICDWGTLQKITWRRKQILYSIYFPIVALPEANRMPPTSKGFLRLLVLVFTSNCKCATWFLSGVDIGDRPKQLVRLLFTPS